MAGRSAILKVDILADASDAAKAVDKLDERIGRFTDGLGKVAGVLASAFAVGKLVDVVKDSAKAADEAAKVHKATAQIIEATGGAAGVTAEQVDALTANLSAMAGVDDEAIQAGSNLLLTFRNVKNAGQGLDAIFDRANAAAVDLAAAGFGDITGNATMLGKALNDPVAGITALTRAGVTFSDQQKEQIKTLTDSGNALEAQKLILAEIEHQVGGTAEASASSYDKMTVALGNLQESFGDAFLPVIDELLPVFLELMDEIGPILKPVAEALAAVAKAAAELLVPILRTLLPILAEVVRSFGVELQRVLVQLAPHLPALAEALGKILLALVPLLPPLADLLIALIPLIDPISELVVVIADAVSWIVSKWVPALNALVAPIHAVASALAYLIDWIRRALDWMVKLLEKISGGILNKIGGIIGIGGWSMTPAGSPTTYGGAAQLSHGGRMAPRAGSLTVNVNTSLSGNPYLIGRQIVRVVNRATSITGPLTDLR
jgi:phage-related protein